MTSYADYDKENASETNGLLNYRHFNVNLDDDDSFDSLSIGICTDYTITLVRDINVFSSVSVVDYVLVLSSKEALHWNFISLYGFLNHIYTKAHDNEDVFITSNNFFYNSNNLRRDDF